MQNLDIRTYDSMPRTFDENVDITLASVFDANNNNSKMDLLDLNRYISVGIFIEGYKHVILHKISDLSFSEITNDGHASVARAFLLTKVTKLDVAIDELDEDYQFMFQDAIDTMLQIPQEIDIVFLIENADIDELLSIMDDPFNTAPFWQIIVDFITLKNYCFYVVNNNTIFDILNGQFNANQEVLTAMSSKNPNSLASIVDSLTNDYHRRFYGLRND